MDSYMLLYLFIIPFNFSNSTLFKCASISDLKTPKWICLLFKNILALHLFNNLQKETPINFDDFLEFNTL